MITAVQARELATKTVVTILSDIHKQIEAAAEVGCVSVRVQVPNQYQGIVKLNMVGAGFECSYYAEGTKPDDVTLMICWK